jgi:hypothetical protein
MVMLYTPGARPEATDWELTTEPVEFVHVYVYPAPLPLPATVAEPLVPFGHVGLDPSPAILTEEKTIVFVDTYWQPEAVIRFTVYTEPGTGFVTVSADIVPWGAGTVPLIGEIH